MPRHFTEQENQLIRKELVSCGRKFFSMYSLNKVTISEIVKKVGIGKGTFYQFFNSKGDLYFEVYRIERDEIQKRLVNKYLSKEGTTKDIIKELILELLDVLSTNTILESVYDEDMQESIHEKSVRDRLLKYNKNTNSALEQLLKHWEDEGRIIGENTDTTVGLIRMITFMRFHKMAIGNDIYNDVITKMVECVVDGIVK